MIKNMLYGMITVKVVTIQDTVILTLHEFEHEREHDGENIYIPEIGSDVL